MSSAFLRGLPMGERTRPGAAPADGDESGARRRLDRWRRQEPFGDPERWQTRLRSDDLSEEALLALLANDPEGVPEPAWASWIGDQMPDWLEPGDSGEESPFFACAVANLLGTARETLAARVPAALLDQLTEPLLWQVHGMLGRTLTLELNLARVAGQADGLSPAGRFEAFLAALRTPERQKQLFTSYPVLARQLSIAVGQWVTNCAELVTRINDDAELIQREFALGQAPGQVKQITLGTGDRHRGGKAVAIVGWESGLTLVYKPRPMAMDVHFGELIDWINAAGLSLPLRSVSCLDRGEYGWAEFITAEPCATEAEIRRFYHRQGALLALMGLLRANDIHSENLIAAGEQPVLIDLETLLQPALPLIDARQTAAERLAGEAAQTSVLQAGLLPTLAWITRDGHAIDISGLGRRPGQESSMSLPVLAGIGTDSMSVRLERVQLDLPDHRPVGKNKELNLLDYKNDIISGYAEMHALCRQRCAELTAGDGPLAAFEGDPARIVVRSTMVYAMLLSTGFHPDVLRDGLERDRHFDYLWRREAQTPALAALIAAERRDLWRNDVPYFGTVTGSSTLLDSDGAVIPGFAVVSGLELARSAVAEWDDEHLAAQLTLIQGSLAAAAINASPNFSFPDYSLPEPAGAATHDELIEAALAIGDELARQAFTASPPDGSAAREAGAMSAEPDSAQWLGLSSQAGKNWVAGSLGPDLFNGIAGVALFLAQLGRLSGVDSHTELARKAVVTMRSQLKRELLLTGGMSGAPGMIYALCRFAELLEDEALSAEALELAGRLGPMISADKQFDLVGGSAGTIVALRMLHSQRPDGPALELIAAAAQRLRDTATEYGPGVGWIPAVMAENGIAEVPPAGLGHGNAGIAWALAEAAALLGERSYADLGSAAIAYEQTLYRPELGSWIDVRQPDDPGMIRAWCHGSTGIGLARLAGRHTLGGPEIDQQIEDALRDSRRHGYGLSHSLCHGDTGTAELLLAGAQHLNRPELRAEAGLRAGQILRSITDHGWISGVPFGTSTPSLMVGLAGIGYGLLRLASPQQVPSVVLLATTAPAPIAATAGATTLPGATTVTPARVGVTASAEAGVTAPAGGGDSGKDVAGEG
jgi:type 2 lantibiotic biosynthesis protein LanM